MQKNNTAIMCLSSNSGGMELDTLRLAKKIRSYSQVVLISKKDTFISKEAKNIDSIISKEVYFKSSFSISLILQIRNIVKEKNIKNFIFFGASELKSIYFSLLGLNINLIIRHGTTKTRPKKDCFHKLIYSNVNYHISISEHILKNVKDIIPFGKQSVECLIYPSIKSINQLSKNQYNSIKLLHTGRITYGKGQIDAIKACNILIKNGINFTFDIVGGYENESEKEKFLTFLNTIEYKENINLVGFTDDISFFLRSSNIFIFPSYGEGFGNSFAEALGTGMICICYENTTFIEFRKLGFYIHIVENKNISVLQETLLHVVHHIDDEYRKSRHNVKLVKEIFSEENEIKKYLKILK